MAALLVLASLFMLMVARPIFRELRKGSIVVPKEIFTRRRIVFGALLFSLIAIPALYVNYLVPKKTFVSAQEMVIYGEHFQQPSVLLEGYSRLLAADPHDLDLNFTFLEDAAFRPFSSSASSGTSPWRLQSAKRWQVVSSYKDLASREETALRDLGNLMLAIINKNQLLYEDALLRLDSVENRLLKYLNYLYGEIYYRTGRIDEAEVHYLQELQIGGFEQGAIRALGKIYYRSGRYEALMQFVGQPQQAAFLPEWLLEYAYFTSKNFKQYTRLIWNTNFRKLNVYGFVGAFLVMLAWLLYVRSLDIYDKEKWYHLIGILLLSALLTYAVFPLSDFVNYELGFSLNGEPLNDFLYCVFGIGAVEELVKIIPVLLYLAFSKSINEPYDYILYGSVSALGFAFSENLMYYEDNHLYMIHTRAITATVAHMFFSSIIAYGMLLSKYKLQRYKFAFFLLFFMLAAIGHGFYDFWLINEWAGNMDILTILFFLISLHLWTTFKNNAINNSNYFEHRVNIFNKKLQIRLVIWLVGIMMFEYVVLAFTYTPSFANNNLLQDSLYTGYLIFYISASFSRFDLIPGYWEPIRFPRNLALPRAIVPANLVGKQVLISSIPFNKRWVSNSAKQGEIVQRCIVSGHLSWFVVQLTTPFHADNVAYQKVLIRSVSPDLLVESRRCPVHVLGVKDEMVLLAAILNKEDFVYVGKRIAEILAIDQ